MPLQGLEWLQHWYACVPFWNFTPSKELVITYSLATLSQLIWKLQKYSLFLQGVSTAGRLGKGCFLWVLISKLSLQALVFSTFHADFLLSRDHASVISNIKHQTAVFLLKQNWGYHKRAANTSHRNMQSRGRDEDFTTKRETTGVSGMLKLCYKLGIIWLLVWISKPSRSCSAVQAVQLLLSYSFIFLWYALTCHWSCHVCYHSVASLS